MWKYLKVYFAKADKKAINRRYKNSSIENIKIEMDFLKSIDIDLKDRSA